MVMMAGGQIATLANREESFIPNKINARCNIMTESQHFILTSREYIWLGWNEWIN